MKKTDSKLMFLSTLFVGFYLLANILAVKKIDLGPFVLTGGLFVFPITFLLTDAINEIFGRIVANRLVWFGFASMALAAAVIQIVIAVPPSAMWAEQEAFQTVLGGTLRITIASMVAYLVSQFHDVWAFDFWKKKTKGKYLWLRNNASTVVSQTIDSTIFILIAFAGLMPNSALIPMITGQLVVKWIIAIADTPFCYLLVSWLGRSKQ
jgi:uncharacterized integral membrane protein (TIGR00697 family)